MAGKKEASRRQAQAVKKRRIEKKPEVPREQRTAPGGAGEERPRRRGSDRNRSKRWKLKKRKTPCV
jgi:hypothetical protein